MPRNLSLRYLLREYPYPSALVLLLAGYFVARRIDRQPRLAGAPRKFGDLTDELGTEQA